MSRARLLVCVVLARGEKSWGVSFPWDLFRTTLVSIRNYGGDRVRVRVHPSVHRRHSDVEDDDVIAAFEGTLRSRARDTHPIQWVGVGLDRKGRLLEYIAVEDEPDGWLVFHAMLVTRAVLAEVGLRR